VKSKPVETGASFHKTGCEMRADSPESNEKTQKKVCFCNAVSSLNILADF